LVVKKDKIHWIATFLDTNLAARQIILALLCFLESLDKVEELTRADLTFLNRLEAIDIPIPEPQIKIPIFLELIFLDSFFA